MAIDNHCYAYEYALLTGETEITYVYLALVEHSTLHFEKKYLPKGYGESEILEIDKSPLSGYCIYQAGGEGGYPLAYEGSYDYTREENVDVEHHHYEAVGYNRCSVCTVLDEEDTERIADCSYIYYENAIASVNSLPEGNSYIDLAGYPFVSLEVDKERMEAYVTYLDNGQEKVRTYKFFVKK